MINAIHLEFGKGDVWIHMGDTSDVAFLVCHKLTTCTDRADVSGREKEGS